MNKGYKSLALMVLSFTLCACTQGQKEPELSLALGDIEDYRDFLEERGDIIKPEPFEPEPLFVSATGKVQAKPDIAVITAKISARDKNESKAVHTMGAIVNAVQAQLKGRDIETGFTAINSKREFDEQCGNDNRFAQRRHAQIRGDYYFNKRLDDKGDTETKRRAPKARVKEKVCFAHNIEVYTDMVIRIKPANAAGDVLRALSDAGAENSQLYGYDFTDYDALYQEAAEKAVKLARKKANLVADKSGGILGAIESFSISAPERQARFGPQPNIIRAANRNHGPHGSVIDRKSLKPQRRVEVNPAPSLASQFAAPADQDEVAVMAFQQGKDNFDSNAVQEAATNRVFGFDRYASKLSVATPQSANTNTNALSISLLSGPQIISVTAQLAYTYDTPLNGKIILEDEES